MFDRSCAVERSGVVIGRWSVSGLGEGDLEPFAAMSVSMPATLLCARKGVRGGPLFEYTGTLQLLNPDHVWERDKALVRRVLVGEVWNGFLLSRVKERPVLW